MKSIFRIIASILAFAFFLVSFVTVFLYSTINVQTHSIYTEYVEAAYEKFKVQIDEELSKMKSNNSSSETTRVPSSNESPDEPTLQDLPLEEIIEIVTSVLGNHASEIDLTSLLTGKSFDSLGDILKNHGSEVDVIADTVCDKYGITKDNLISDVISYLNDNNVDTEQLKESTSVSDLIGGIFTDNSTGAKDVITKVFEEVIQKDKTGITEKINDVVYDAIDKKAQQLLVIIKNFMLTKSFENTLQECIRTTTIDLCDSIENETRVTLPEELYIAINNNESNLNSAFSDVLSANNMTYAEFSILTDEVLLNSLDGYKIGTFNLLTSFTTSLKNLIKNYEVDINNSVNFDDVMQSFSKNVPHVLLVISSKIIALLFSSYAIFVIIGYHILLVFILSLFSLSFSYGLKLVGFIGIFDGLFLLFLMFLSNHVTSFFTKIDEGVLLLDMLVQNLKLSWKVSMIWCISIGVAIVILSIIISILSRKKARQ